MRYSRYMGFFYMKYGLLQSHTRGISLIETLTVVSIITLLLIAGLTQYMRQLPKARDGRRKADLQEIKVSLEDYYNDNQCYPQNCALSGCAQELNGYIKGEVPLDPGNDTPYIYVTYPNSQGVDCGGYRILTALEMSEDPDILRLGCQNGCGGIPPELVPGGMSPLEYTYGVSSGVTVNQ